jgi:aspartyl-tRNA(Asn)/glutamyl-tRNA(Gln) amidotransferase subunit A
MKDLTLSRNNPREELSRRRFLEMTAPGAVGFLAMSDSMQSIVEASVAKESQTNQLTDLTLSEAAAVVRSKQVSPVELTQACLAHVEQLNPKLNAFITVTAESALAQARAAEAEIRAKRWRGPLHGIPIALKDLIDTAGVKTTAASALFEGRIPQQDAQVVQRLKAAGAVLLGKLNLHECAYGASGIISFYGAVRNPWSQNHVPGGSSSGSAVAVAAGMCFGALGTDTGGSIRLPSALCGTVGLKPTFGRVSCRGVLPLAWSLDHMGPMTRTVADAALMLQVIAGYDPEDTVTQDVPVSDFSRELSKSVSSLRVGLPNDFFADLDPEIRVRVDEAIAVLRRLTADTRDVVLALNPDNTIQKAEAYACHAENIVKRPELYSAETLWRLRSGQNITAPDYIQARRNLDLLRREVGKVFANVDVLVMPAVPVATPLITELKPGEQGNLRKTELATLRNTRPFNVYGLPAISVPCGFTGAGLPVGIQIAGPPWGEAVVLRLAHVYEQATGWCKRRPPLA